MSFSLASRRPLAFSRLPETGFDSDNPLAASQPRHATNPFLLPRIDGYSSYLGHQMHRQAHKLKGGHNPVIRQCSGENDLKQKPSGKPLASPAKGPAKGSCQLADEGPNGPSSWLVSGSPGPDRGVRHRPQTSISGLAADSPRPFGSLFQWANQEMCRGQAPANCA
ncbi:hypothetical protein THAR02_00814 [Trichoderma harzianum]|uniref:Uncharacterized protein n=1 Tax=Trichoderma harzianum TaxID=5544 RepID=A0A0F9XRL5_TRIHA|nr:hypothetical protein THAR02_00814 [Trichoderma harzianum]